MATNPNDPINQEKYVERWLSGSPSGAVCPVYAYRGGLTKREYFAAMAMQGILSNSSIVPSIFAGSVNVISEASTAMSDALIAELNKEK